VTVAPTALAHDRRLALAPDRGLRHGPARPLSALPLVAAHRGHVHGGHHENTLGAFEHAIRVGADIIELDVHRTRDGVLVVHHDARIGGITGPRIRDLDFAQLPPVGPRAEPIPTLEQVVRLSRGRVKLDVELKASGFEHEAADMLRALVPANQFVMKSFLPESVALLSATRPDITVGMLVPHLPGAGIVRRTVGGAGLARDAALLGADFIGSNHRQVSGRLLDRARADGLSVWVWTVNDARRMARLVADPRVSVVITDDTPMALSTRARFAKDAHTRRSRA
jgi:glycerophosphoryl diester phosphodiesterase